MLTLAVPVRDLNKYLGRKIFVQFDQLQHEFRLHHIEKHWSSSSVYLYEVGRFDPIFRLHEDFFVSVRPEFVAFEEPKVEPKKEVEVTKEVFGRPVKGDIHETAPIPKQDDPIKVIHALDELLALDGVLAYKWVQYTPYWMDGEECEFGVVTDYNAGVKLSFGNEDGGEAGDGFYESFSTSYYPELREVDTSLHEDALNKVVRVLHSGAHDVWLKETFGDHASVTATVDGFEVEFYEHD
jgi:hypothetical protein